MTHGTLISVIRGYRLDTFATGRLRDKIIECFWKGKQRRNKAYRPGNVAEYETVRAEAAEDSDIIVCSLS